MTLSHQWLVCVSTLHFWTPLLCVSWWSCPGSSAPTNSLHTSSKCRTRKNRIHPVSCNNTRADSHDDFTSEPYQPWRSTMDRSSSHWFITPVINLLISSFPDILCGLNNFILTLPIRLFVGDQVNASLQASAGRFSTWSHIPPKPAFNFASTGLIINLRVLWLVLLERWKHV